MARILVEIAQQTNVHFFKHIIWELERRGHEVCIVARDRELTLPLLDIYGFKYHNISKARPGRLNLLREMLERDYKIYRIARAFKPDVMVGRTVCFTHVSRLTGIPSILDDDDGLVTGFVQRMKYWCASAITTPDCLKDDLGAKQVRYAGYKELAYLHPNRFTPNAGIRDELGLRPGERFFVLRFSALKAFHDVGKQGIAPETKRRIAKELEKHGRVFITSESPLEGELEKYRVPVSPHKMHDMLYYANLYAGDSQTMATEAAVLGTPSVRCSPFVGKSAPQEELEHRYGLTYGFKVDEQERALEKIRELLDEKDLKQQWQQKRERMLAEKIDVTAFMVDFIERYLQSF